MTRKMEATYVYEDGYDFPVIVERVLGTVKVGPGGTYTPYQAAFQIIGEEGEPGTYRFPIYGPDGKSNPRYFTVVVTMEEES